MVESMKSLPHKLYHIQIESTFKKENMTEAFGRKTKRIYKTEQKHHDS